MRARKGIWLLSTFVSAYLLIGAAQVPASPPPNDPPAVTITFLAEDKVGNPVGNLQISDLSVQDNGKPPMPIVSLGSATELPLRLGVLIDNNPFYGLYYSDKLPEYNRTPQWVLDFVEEMLTGPDDKAFIASYSSVQHGAVFVSRDELKPIDLAHFLKFDAPDFFGYGEAVVGACKNVFGAEPAGQERRILIVIGGSDRQAGSEELRHYPTSSYKTISAAAERAGVKVFTFGWLISDHPGKGPLVYHPVYQPVYGWFETGGWVLTWQPDPSSWFKLLKSQIDSMHSLTYVPAEPYHPGKLRRLDLKTTNKGWHVHAPKRYLTPSAQ